MDDILADLRTVVATRGDTYSSAEVIGLCALAYAEIGRLRAALTELADASEHDMKLNQGGDNHEDEPESSGGWWSPRTENAIRTARALTSGQRGNES